MVDKPLYPKEFQAKTWDEMTEAERAARAEKAFSWEPHHLRVKDLETGEWIDAATFAERYPLTEIDEIEDWDEDETHEDLIKRLWG
jgi:hypothetical protein